MIQKPHGRVLIIAGSDSGGGAGIQADIKTVTCLGGYAATAVTAVTVQNTLGVQGIYPLPTQAVIEQAQAVLEDIGVDAIKIGMLHTVEVIEAVANLLPPSVPVVLDPVMVATSGDLLLEHQAIAALQEQLLPKATLLTPNLPEAATLLNLPIPPQAAQLETAQRLLDLGPQAVLLKDGHGQEETVTDLLLPTETPPLTLTAPRLNTRHTHGTGCTLASACAVGLAQGLDLTTSVKRAHAFVQQALKAAPGYGQGHGPLGHCFF